MLSLFLSTNIYSSQHEQQGSTKKAARVAHKKTKREYRESLNILTPIVKKIFYSSVDIDKQEIEESTKKILGLLIMEYSFKEIIDHSQKENFDLS